MSDEKTEITTRLDDDPTWFKDLEKVIESKDGVETSNVSVNTQLVCEKCGGHSFLRDKTCVKCDHGWI